MYCSGHGQSLCGGHLSCVLGGCEAPHYWKMCGSHSTWLDGQLVDKNDLVSRTFKTLLPHNLFSTLLDYEEQGYLVLMKTPIFYRLSEIGMLLT